MIFYSLKLKIKHTERIQDESDQNNKVQNCKPGKTFDISLHRSDSLLHLVHLLDLGIKFVEQILNVAVALYVLRMYLLGEICLDGFQLCCRILKQRLDLGDLSFWLSALLPACAAKDDRKRGREALPLLCPFAVILREKIEICCQ